MALTTATAAVSALSPSGYWKLNDGSGATATATVGTNGTYVGSPTLDQPDAVQSGLATDPDGSKNPTLTTAVGKYGNLGKWTGLASAILGSGATICFRFNVSAAGNLIGGFEGASTQGFSVTIDNNGDAGDGLTLTVKDNANTSFVRRFKRPFCPIWLSKSVHCAVRIKLTQGASSSGGTLDVVVDGVPLTADAANYGDVVTDNTVGAISDLSTGSVAIGNVMTGASAGTAITGKFSEVAWFPSLLTTRQICQIAAGGVWDGTVGAQNPYADFDFTDVSKMYSDAAGTTPITAVGQEVLKVVAVYGDMYLTATAGQAPTWNGNELEFDNRFGSSEPANVGMVINTLPTKARQIAMGFVAVVAPLAQTVFSVTNPTIVSFLGSSAGARLDVIGDSASQRSLSVASAGVGKTPNTPASFPYLASAPSFCLVAGSMGANGSGAVTAETNATALLVNETLSTDNSNVSGGANANKVTNGAYYNPFTSGYVGIALVPGVNPSAEFTAGYASVFSGKMRRLCIYTRALSPAGEMPYMLDRAIEADATLAAAVGATTVAWFIGDSITSMQSDDGSPAVDDLGEGSTMLGYQSRLSLGLRQRIEVRNLSIGAQQINAASAYVTARLAVDPRNRQIVVVYLGTNDISQNQSLATIQSRLDTLFGNIASALPDATVLVFKINTSGAVSGSGATPAQVNAELASREGTDFDLLIDNPNSADLHPDGEGQQDLADALEAAIREAIPSLFPSSGSGRIPRVGRITRVAR